MCIIMVFYRYILHTCCVPAESCSNIGECKLFWIKMMTTMELPFDTHENKPVLPSFWIKKKLHLSFTKSLYCRKLSRQSSPLEHLLPWSGNVLVNVMVVTLSPSGCRPQGRGPRYWQEEKVVTLPCVLAPCLSHSVVARHNRTLSRID